MSLGSKVSGFTMNVHAHQCAELRAVAHQGSASSGKAQLDMFNTLLDTFRRTMNNASMIPHWDALTANIVENF